MSEGRMATLVREYLAYRRGLGFKLRAEGAELVRFAAFADAEAPDGPLDTLLALRWARLPAGAGPLYCARRLEIVRCFARYVAVFDHRTQIPPAGILGPAHRRLRPHICSVQEVADLLKACAALGPAGSLRPCTYATLFGLLACSGLRVSEALRLADRDVDLAQGILTIRETKFRKSRLVPLSPSARDALRSYRQRRERHCPVPLSGAFFLTDGGRAIAYGTLRHTFRALARRLGWEPTGGGRRPRMYDLRHTFATRRLAAWQQEGANLAVLLPVLSTYLGHGKVADTYWYLTAIPELMRTAAVAFEQFARSDDGAQP